MKIKRFDEIWAEPIDVESSASEASFRTFELRMLRSLLRPVPDDPAALFRLGNELTRAGDHKEALEVDQKLVELRPEDPISHYNLACSYSNLRETDQALEALEQAFELGYWDLEHMEQDPDLDHIKEDPRFLELVEEHFEFDPDMTEFL